MKFQSQTDGLRHPDRVRLLQQQLHRITIDPSFASSRILRFFLSFLFFLFFLDPILDFNKLGIRRIRILDSGNDNGQKTMGNIFSKRSVERVRGNVRGTNTVYTRRSPLRRWPRYEGIPPRNRWRRARLNLVGFRRARLPAEGLTELQVDRVEGETARAFPLRARSSFFSHQPL